MSKNHIDLSIIIPTLGRNDSLARCLDSIFHLNWEPYSVEVLVICNPPQDQIQRQVEIRNEFGFSLQYVAMKSKGANRSRNRGADLAQGKTLLFLDDDVSLLSNQFMSNFGIHSGEGRGLASGWGGYYFNSPNAGMASKIYNAAANMW
ncbi:MAG: glycosyltransferase family 2 protein, partial [Bdellovibrionales bacterium]|nr:glycosyltransferase family 2 protein [Bdellovibrionales bacterium]